MSESSFPDQVPAPDLSLMERLFEQFAYNITDLRLRCAALVLLEIEHDLCPFRGDLPVEILNRLDECHFALSRLRDSRDGSGGLITHLDGAPTQH